MTANSPKARKSKKEMFPFLASGMAHGLDATRRDLTSAWPVSCQVKVSPTGFEDASKCLYTLNPCLV